MRRFLPLMRLSGLVLLVVGCASDVRSVEAPPTGECSSTTRLPLGGGYADVVTWYDAQRREVRATRDTYDVDGTWLSQSVEAFGYVGDLLVSYTRQGKTPEEDGLDFGEGHLRVYEHDEEGRTIREQHFDDGRLTATLAYRYDELGQYVRGDFTDHVRDYDQFSDWWWRDGRVEGWETWDTEGRLLMFEDYEYLGPAPALDREVRGGSDFWLVERYDGEWLIETESFIGGAFAGFQQWVRRPDGQEVLERTIEPEETRLVRSEYDDGWLVRREWGVDLDGDDVIDELVSEQTWAWSCD